MIEYVRWNRGREGGSARTGESTGKAGERVDHCPGYGARGGLSSRHLGRGTLVIPLPFSTVRLMVRIRMADGWGTSSAERPLFRVTVRNGFWATPSIRSHCRRIPRPPMGPGHFHRNPLHSCAAIRTPRGSRSRLRGSPTRSSGSPDRGLPLPSEVWCIGQRHYRSHVGDPAPAMCGPKARQRGPSGPRRIPWHWHASLPLPGELRL
jgi:hypothetical protein